MRRLVGGEVLVLSVIDFNRQGIVANLIVRDLVPHPQNPLDKQIAATVLLCVRPDSVTHNAKHFVDTGVKLLDPCAD